ncbi:MAG TPA: hypothetical protein VM223_09845, partial [Planctomycetota bacterium]|nr:hypothetical protein [Planctomycetota bacterium]
NGETRGGEDDTGGETLKPALLCAQGSPAQAFQSISDQCHDNAIARLKSLSIRIEGAGKQIATDARSLGLAIPQMGKAAFSLNQHLVLQFGDGDQFSGDFAGSWERYKRIKSVTDNLSSEASNASVRMAVKIDFDAGLDVAGDQLQTIRDVLDTMNMGKVYLGAVPIYPESR